MMGDGRHLVCGFVDAVENPIDPLGAIADTHVSFPEERGHSGGRDSGKADGRPDALPRPGTQKTAVNREAIFFSPQSHENTKTLSHADP
jgi:hypothetical protein